MLTVRRNATPSRPSPIRPAAGTIQALGWRSPLEGQKRYLPLQDDIPSTALWYQTEPHAAFPALPGLTELEVTQLVPIDTLLQAVFEVPELHDSIGGGERRALTTPLCSHINP